MRPTPRGWWVLAITISALALGLWWRYPGMVTVAAALGVLTLLDAGSVALSGRPRVRRIVTPTEVPRYGQCSGQLVIEHSGRWSRLRAEAHELVAGSAVTVEIGDLRPADTSRVSYLVPTSRRGVLAIGPLWIDRYGFAGLAVASSPEGGEAVVRVLPRVLPVRALPPGARRGHVGAEERVARGGTDIVGLHEYVPGDDLRRVHWATSARTGTLMVREDADPARAHLAVLLDDRSGSYVGPDDFEHAVEVAASLVGAACDEGHPVRLRTLAGGLDVSGLLTGPDALAPLADASLVDSMGAGAGPLMTRDDLDVLALVTGATAQLPPLMLAARRATVGVVLVVGDVAAVQAPTVSGRAVVLRHPRADELLAAWDSTVSSRPVIS